MRTAVDDENDRTATTVAFVLEQTLGHVTHSANLAALVPPHAAARSMSARFVPVAFEPGRWGRVPGWSNWTVRAGWRAHRALHTAFPDNPPEAMFVHTQVPAVLLRSWMNKVPTIVSLDATPRQYDQLGEFYRHSTGRPSIERVKHRLNRRCFERASHIVTWSTWARDDLIAHYGVEPDRISVIPPGVDTTRWRPAASSNNSGRPVQVLFVGGDLQRKGGQHLIDACRRLRARHDVPDFELHLVTGAPVPPEPGVTAHAGLTPNSEALLARFADADVFCLPTLGDCLPMVLAEAGATGLPLISSAVGAIHEIVQPGTSGELIEPGDVDALEQHLARLIGDPDLRRRYGMAARRIVEDHHDADANAARLVALLDRSTE